MDFEYTNPYRTILRREIILIGYYQIMECKTDKYVSELYKLNRSLTRYILNSVDPLVKNKKKMYKFVFQHHSMTYFCIYRLRSKNVQIQFSKLNYTFHEDFLGQNPS